MPRSARRECESDIYHITSRGAGRMDIFEDDDDRREFLRLLEARFRDCSVELLAWCLMSNHIHLLVKAPLGSVSSAMHGLLGRYAAFFNGKHGHVGHLFQGRFASKPVLDDSQLMATVRYIHLNPAETGQDCFESYPWSSYREYAGDSESALAQTGLVSGVSGSKEEFVRFHRDGAGLSGKVSGDAAQRVVLSDEMARAMAEGILGPNALEGLKGLEREARDGAIALLKGKGLSVRQIERLTGIGRGIVQRATLGDE